MALVSPPSSTEMENKNMFLLYNIFQNNVYDYKDIQKYVCNSDDVGQTIPRITPSKQSVWFPTAEESDFPQLLLEKWWPGGTLQTRLSLIFFSPRRLRISGVNCESSIFTSFRLEQCLVTVNSPASVTFRQQLQLW